MVHRERLAFFLSVSFLALFLSVMVHGAPVQTSGVVVERIASDSEAGKAGLKEGDIILRWSRGDAKGEIDSPFDLSELEVEQAPRGEVTFEGFRGTERLVWILRGDKWGIKARLQMSDPLLSIYRQCQEMAKAGKFAEAAENWKMASGQEEQSQSPAATAWLFLETGELLGHERQWQPADQAYQEAVQQPAGLGPEILSQVLLRWAASY